MKEETKTKAGAALGVVTLLVLVVVELMNLGFVTTTELGGVTIFELEFLDIGVLFGLVILLVA